MSLSNSSRAQYRRYRVEVAERRRREMHRGVDGAGPRHRGRSFVQLLWEFLGLLKGQRAALAWALATVSCATLLRLLPPAATKLIIDNVLMKNPLPEGWRRLLRLPADRLELLLVLTACVVAISLLSTAVHLWGRWEATKTVNRLLVRIRRRLFEHILRLDLHRIYELKSGGAASLLREDAGAVADLVFSMFYNPWQAVIQLIGSLAVLMFVDWRLLLGGLLLVPVVYVTHRTWIGRIRPLHRDARAQRQEIDGHATETFAGIRVVRTFGRQRSESARYVLANHLLIRKQLLVWWWSRIVETIWDVLIPVASTGLLLYGGYRVLEGYLTLGDLTMFLVYLTMLLSPIATLASSAAALQNGLAGLDRVLDLLAEPEELPDRPAAVSLRPSHVAGRITISGVEFRYPASQQLVLKGLDLEIPAGQTVALFGRSGSGKSTLCNLVARFYDPTRGSICLDGIDLKGIRRDSYRRLLGIVEQDVFLFDGTIRDNIAYAVRHADDAAVERAARLAHADEFIVALEHGYRTIVGERGVKLSGGQRQRLAIARAILADPRVLILDEATSNLDSESEQFIRQSLAELMEDRTCLVIAHRLSTVLHADRIVLLDEGKIRDAGTHAELMERCEDYRRVVDLQLFDRSAAAVLRD